MKPGEAEDLRSWGGREAGSGERQGAEQRGKDSKKKTSDPEGVLKPEVGPVHGT